MPTPDELLFELGRRLYTGGPTGGNWAFFYALKRALATWPGTGPNPFGPTGMAS